MEILIICNPEHSYVRGEQMILRGSERSLFKDNLIEVRLKYATLNTSGVNKLF